MMERQMNRWSEEQTGRAGSGEEKRKVAGIIGQIRLKGEEAVVESNKRFRGEKRAGGVRHAFNFLTEALAMQTNVFSSAH